MEQGPRTDRRWDVLTLAVILLLVAAHLRYALLDQRLPHNTNVTYFFCHLFHEMGDADGPAQALRNAALGMAGWYNLSIAVAMKIVGRAPMVLHLFNAAWMALVLLGTALIARRLWGPAAAFAAVVLIPPDGYDLVMMARVSGIHIPEMALLLGVLVPLIFDPRLSRWSTAVVVGLAGAGALSMRLSSLIWMTTLLPLLLACVWHGPQRKDAVKKIGVVFALWALAAPPIFVYIRTYVGDKLGHHAEFAADRSLSWFYSMFTNDLGGPVFWIGLGLAAVTAVLWRPLPTRFLLVLLSWWGLSCLLMVLFVAGARDFPMYYVAFALLVAGALSRLPSPLLLLLLLIWGPRYVTQFLPAPSARAVSQVVHDVPAAHDDSILNHYRVYEGLGGSQFGALLRSTCPEDERKTCRILIPHDQGLCTPQPWDSGISDMEIFFLGRTHVHVDRLPADRDRRPANERGPPHALGGFFCTQEDERTALDPREQVRFRSEQTIRRYGFREVWRAQVDSDCQYVWSTPDGTVRRRDSLPDLPR